MTVFKRATAALVAGVLSFAAPAYAGWKLIPASVDATVGSIKFRPSSDWNQDSSKPGKQGVAWTHDGYSLNRIEYFSGVRPGQPMYRERNKKQNPMPKFDKSLLLPDLGDFFERSFRVQNQVANFTVEKAEPVTFLSKRGLAVRYRYTLLNDDLIRRGEARLVVINGSLYAINFQAPALHYFEAGASEARDIMDKAHL